MILWYNFASSDSMWYKLYHDFIQYHFIIYYVSCDTILYIMRILYHTLQYEIEHMYNAILYHIIWCVKTIKSNIPYTRSLTDLICERWSHKGDLITYVLCLWNTVKEVY